MQTIKLSCNQCGGPLVVEGETRFVTCRFCESQLEVVREGNAAFTRELEELRKTTDTLADEVEELKLRNELLHLEQRWDRKSEQLMVTGKNGEKFVPTETQAVLMGVIGGAVSLFAIVAFLPIGLVFAGITTFGVISTLNSAKKYRDAKRRYTQRRAELHSQLDRI